MGPLALTSTTDPTRTRLETTSRAAPSPRSWLAYRPPTDPITSPALPILVSFLPWPSISIRKMSRNNVSSGGEGRGTYRRAEGDPGTRRRHDGRAGWSCQALLGDGSIGLECK
jgi:hypothetical protein